MGRGGRTTYREDPERRCLVSGDTQPKRGLVRFAVAPDGTVVPDVLGRLPGRGLWVSAERALLEAAVTRKVFSRGAKTQVIVPADLVDQVEAALVRRTVEVLSMARKAGQAVTGFEKVKDWLVKEQAAILIQASDGSDRGKSKLRPPGGRGSFFDVLSASELGLAFGREHVIHAALAPGGLAEKFREDAIRLSGVREDGGGKLATGKVKKTI